MEATTNALLNLRSTLCQVDFLAWTEAWRSFRLIRRLIRVSEAVFLFLNYVYCCTKCEVDIIIDINFQEAEWTEGWQGLRTALS